MELTSDTQELPYKPLRGKNGKEKTRLYMKQYRLVCPERLAASSKKYYDAHRDEILAQERVKYASDPELRKKQQERKKKWREANKERISEYNRQYRESKKTN